CRQTVEGEVEARRAASDLARSNARARMIDADQTQATASRIAEMRMVHMAVIWSEIAPISNPPMGNADPQAMDQIPMTRPRISSATLNCTSVFPVDRNITPPKPVATRGKAINGQAVHCSDGTPHQM